MYLLSATVENIRSVKAFTLEFGRDECPGWHVLIGDNGSGKSTLIRAIAFGLIGPVEAAALRQNWGEWIRLEEESGRIELELAQDPKHDEVVYSENTTGRPITVEMQLQLQHANGHNRRSADLRVEPEILKNAIRSVWDNGKGWFSASYGPFRRFAGGDKDYDKLFYSHPRLAAHLSAFGEDVALSECLRWLQTLHVKKLEGNPEGNLLDDLTRFVNEGKLLPHGAVLEEVTSEAVYFRDGNGCHIDVEQLSDGYRSILSLTFELIRQMVQTYGRDQVFSSRSPDKITVPGVVLIDEIDAHLHPTWQRQIGRWFRERFPNIQFIVTTHSPLVCQSAERGSVWRLPTPGDDSEGGRVTGIELKRLIYGNALEAYGTELFGRDVNRSESSKAKMTRLAELNQKVLRHDLSTDEQSELEGLRAMLPTSAGVLSTEAGGDR